MQNPDQYQQFASINIDCSGKIDYSAVTNTSSFNNHQILDAFVNEPCQATIYFNNQENMENVDIDDLLDVLRDDQGKKSILKFLEIIFVSKMLF